MRRQLSSLFTIWRSPLTPTCVTQVSNIGKG